MATVGNTGGNPVVTDSVNEGHVDIFVSYQLLVLFECGT